MVIFLFMKRDRACKRVCESGKDILFFEYYTQTNTHVRDISNPLRRGDVPVEVEFLYGLGQRRGVWNYPIVIRHSGHACLEIIYQFILAGGVRHVFL